MSTWARPLEGLVLRRSTDEAVFERALRGDDVAFSEVYRRYHDRIFAFCLSRLLSVEAANDATQEVFLRALSSNPESVRNPGSWLFGVARHVCIDVDRAAQRTQATDTTEFDCGDLGLADEGTAEQGALSREAAATILLALRRTNPRYRSALILREIHQQPMPDVAEALGVSLGSAYTILSRARDAFGKAYSEVLGLSEPCRKAVEMTYRRTGTGLSQAESNALEAHLDSCPRCRREAERADGNAGLRALLPLLPVMPLKAPSLLARAAMAFGSQPWPTQVASTAGSEWSAAKIATTVAVTAGLVTAAVTVPYAARPSAVPTASPTQVQTLQRMRTASDPTGDADVSRVQTRIMRSGTAGDVDTGGVSGTRRTGFGASALPGYAGPQSGPAPSDAEGESANGGGGSAAVTGSATSGTGTGGSGAGLDDSSGTGTGGATDDSGEGGTGGTGSSGDTGTGGTRTGSGSTETSNTGGGPGPSQIEVR